MANKDLFVLIVGIILTEFDVDMVSIDFKTIQEKMMISYSKEDKVIHASYSKLTKIVVHRKSENYDEIHDEFEKKFNDEKNRRILRKL